MTFPADQRQAGLHLYARFDSPVTSRGALHSRQTDFAATRTGDAQPGHRDHDEEPATGPDPGGLEPEQCGEDDHRALFAPGRAQPTVAARAAGPRSRVPAFHSCADDEVPDRVVSRWRPARRLSTRLPICPDLADVHRSSGTPENTGPVPTVQNLAGNKLTRLSSRSTTPGLHYDFRLERAGVLVFRRR